MTAVDTARAMVRDVAGVTMAEREGGVVLDVATRAGHAAVALQGAQVLHWQPAGQTHDVLWMSPVAVFGGGKAIRGGVPICWPWFGPHAEVSKPQHGYARNALWQLAEASRVGDDISLVFDLPDSVPGREHLDGTARVRFRVRVGHSLDMTLETHNSGTTPLILTHALHTYLRVGDVGQIAIDGLDGATYRDNTDGGRAKEQHGTLTIPRETVAIFDAAPAEHVLVDPVLNRRIIVTRTSGASSVVWNPGASAAGMGDVPPPSQLEFVCIEGGSVGASVVTLAPQASASIGQRLQVQRLDGTPSLQRPSLDRARSSIAP